MSVKTQLTLTEVARLFGKDVPARGRCYCPVRQHKRQDKTASVFRADSGDMLLECFSCDAPDNVWDAVGLHAALAGTDRRAAWCALKDQGYAVPGLDPEREGAPPSGARAAKAADRPAKAPERPMPIEGRPHGRVLAMPEEAFETLVRHTDVDLIARFAIARHLPADLLLREGVVTARTRLGEVVGFRYRDPASGKACRVKFKYHPPPEKGPPYFVRPWGDAEHEGVALAPLYRGESVRPGLPAFIVEGEIDALTLVALGFENVVSLPDGVDCAKHCDLSPIAHATPWLVCTDADPPGDRAAAALAKRASVLAVDTIRVRWTRIGDDGGLTTAKDSNEALQRGYTREDFLRCIQNAFTERFGFDPALVR